MKIVAILILGYFMIGFLAGLVVFEPLKAPKKTPVQQIERPPFERPLEFLLLAVFMALPIAGVVRAKKQGTFLHLPAKFWMWGPLSLAILGFGAAYPAWHYLK